MGVELNAAMNVENVNTSSLERLVGYNSKRVSFAVMNALTTKLQDFGLHSPIDYSVLNVVGNNPGITSRKLCHALALFPPNVVGIVRGFEDRHLLEKRQHPTDRRAQGLYLTEQGLTLHARTEAVVAEVDIAVTHALNRSERAQLNTLLCKIYASDNPNRPCWG